MVERRPAQQKPGDGSRQTQLTQLQKRYSTTYKQVSADAGGTTLRLAMKPTDPDFPFELEALQLQMVVPMDYPKQPATITVMNSDIPKGFAINLERGFEEYTDSTKTTLVRQLTWLDRNMESLLQQQPSETMRFVSYPKRNRNAVAPALPDHIIKSAAVTSTSAPPPTTAVSSSPSSSTAPPPAPSPARKTTVDITSSPHTTTTKHSDAELAAAFGRRSKEIDQLRTRLGNSFKASKSDRTVHYVSIELTDPDFTHGSLFDDGVARLRYHVPLQYPLLPCYIDIENKGVSKSISSMIVQQFNYHVKSNPDYTLFEHLNWLNRHLESILNSPTTPSNMDNITPLLRPVRPQAAPRPPIATDATLPTTSSSLKKSLFVDDQAKSKVVMVNDPSLVRPPGATQDKPTLPNNSSDNQVDASTSAPIDPSSSSSAMATPALDVSAPQALRRGTEVRLIQPQLENVSLFRCVSLHVLVKCTRCKNTVDLENIIPEGTMETPSEAGSTSAATTANKKERWTSCPTCHSIIGVKFLSELIHENASSLGLLQLAGCTAFDLLGSSFMGTCGNCMDDMKTSIRLSPNDRPITQACFQCHTKLTLALNDYRFVPIGQGGERLVADEAQVMKLKTKRNKSKKEAMLNGGQPLPNEGTCSHYQKSKRWFRFTCCGKLYPCDICHDKEEDHVYEMMATRHVCGLCSKEQSAVGNKPCVACGHEFEKATGKGAFWEGGQGVRNRSLMSRNDTHKHKGASKTGSKKQDRVGLAAKQKREKDQQRQHHDD